MATKKSSKSAKTWPYVVEGSHSRFTHYEDGSVHHEIFWDRLAEDIDRAIQSNQEKSNQSNTPSPNKIDAVPNTKTSSVSNKRNKFVNSETSKTDSGKSNRRSKSKKTTNQNQ